MIAPLITCFGGCSVMVHGKAQCFGMLCATLAALQLHPGYSSEVMGAFSDDHCWLWSPEAGQGLEVRAQHSHMTEHSPITPHSPAQSSLHATQITGAATGKIEQSVVAVSSLSSRYRYGFEQPLLLGGWGQLAPVLVMAIDASIEAVTCPPASTPSAAPQPPSLGSRTQASDAEYMGKFSSVAAMRRAWEQAETLHTPHSTTLHTTSCSVIRWSPALCSPPFTPSLPFMRSARARRTACSCTCAPPCSTA